MKRSPFGGNRHPRSTSSTRTDGKTLTRGRRLRLPPRSFVRFPIERHCPLPRPLPTSRALRALSIRADSRRVQWRRVLRRLPHSLPMPSFRELLRTSTCAPPRVCFSAPPRQRRAQLRGGPSKGKLLARSTLSRGAKNRPKRARVRTPPCSKRPARRAFARGKRPHPSRKAAAGYRDLHPTRLLDGRTSCRRAHPLTPPNQPSPRELAGEALVSDFWSRSARWRRSA